jgi:uncharacterized protein (TIGR02266 family)
MSAPEDKRQERRVALILQVQYPDREGFIDDQTENLCSGGAFVRTDRSLAVGDRLPLSIAFPGLLEPVRFIGAVAWVRPRRGDEASGVGIKIPEDRPADRKRLQELMNDLGPHEAARPAKSPPTAYRVLIVEDNPHLSDMYEYVIRKMAKTDVAGKAAFDVAICADGHQAWQRLSSENFDLVLADMFMPVLDGFALLERMRQDERLKNVPVVAISAGDAQAQARAKASGATLYLRKPVRFVEVLETVRSLLKLQA